MFHFVHNARKLMVYFHGHAQTISKVQNEVNFIGESLKMHTLIVEYPGYGVYRVPKNRRKMETNALHVYDFLTENLGFNPEDIVVFGRSIGSGPACYLASQRKLGMLILQSAYSDINQVIKENTFGISGFFGFCLGIDEFKNSENIAKVQAPVFLIHGKKDNLISFKHSVALFNVLKKLDKDVELELRESMTHNEVNLFKDITETIKAHLDKLNQFQEGEMDTSGASHLESNSKFSTMYTSPRIPEKEEQQIYYQKHIETANKRSYESEERKLFAKWN